MAKFLNNNKNRNLKLSIMRLIGYAPGCENNELARTLGEPKAVITKQLYALKRAGYVEAPKRGKYRLLQKGKEMLEKHPDAWTEDMEKRAKDIFPEIEDRQEPKQAVRVEINADSPAEAMEQFASALPERWDLVHVQKDCIQMAAVLRFKGL